MSTVEQQGDGGSLNVHEDVLAKIAFKEAASEDGLVSLAGMPIDDIHKALEKNKKLKGIEIEMGEGEVALVFSAVVAYGVSIPELAGRIRDRVSSAIETMTGFRVRAINIAVDGVEVPGDSEG